MRILYFTKPCTHFVNPTKTTVK